ncbi:MAG: VWA domain-containing protein [Myxococcales bacterium]|nr:VWA domain-containing protein [Myxococcales bacterium]
MPTRKRRTITIALLSCAGVIAAVAAALAARGGGQSLPQPPHIAKPTPQRNIPPVVQHNTPTPPPKPTPPVVKKVDPPKPKQVEPPKVDVVFALDTTGSMAGLISGAKRKIWSMANKILSGQPRPHVRIGLIGYRDIGDAYVTRRYQLTEDIDDVQRHLRGFRAAGGGDTPEHVNRALADAIYKMKWRQGQNVLRMIFLVGDAPPHEGRQGLYSRTLASAAKTRGIVINAVRCGSMTSTAVAWRRIARIAGGMYASIRQDGGMYAVRTPLDKRLAKLNAELTKTLVVAGSSSARHAAAARAKANASLDTWGGAESATYRARSGRVDSKDLLTQMARGRKLSSFKKTELPPALQAMKPSARAHYVEKVRAKRQRIQSEILRLAKKRDAYIRRSRRAKPKRAFDDKLIDAFRAAGGKAGIKY